MVRAPRWVRVRDTETGHQYDINPRSMRAKHERLDDPRWPDLYGAASQPRRPLHNVAKDGGPATRPRRAKSPAPPADQNGAPQ